MEYLAFAFGIFGFMAFLSLSSLKGRVRALENQLRSLQGTDYAAEKASLIEAAKAYIGQPVQLSFKEDEEDGDVLLGGSTWSKGFARIAIWTLVWAFFSTFTCYFGGLLVAVQLKEIGVKIAGVFRFIFILPYAVPSVITMLVWKNMLNGTFGIVNRTLKSLGILGADSIIPWLGNSTLAKVMCIVINLWAGFGYFMMLTMGTMTAIGNDLFEAAKIDGANNRQILHHITLPLVMYQTMPLIIMSFMHNINNFGIIFFLTGGQPAVAYSTITRAGGTDILVTWIYNLTITLLKYNYASVIAVLIFAVLAPFAVYQFMNTKAYKEGEV